MDVESLAKQLILQNMTPEQQMAVLDGIKASVAQAKEVQKRKIGENVDLVVQALKKIESDIRDRYDLVGNQLEKRISSIKDGRDGANGKDGRDGKDGKPGKDGLRGPAGRDGKDGKNGVDGIDGISVISANIDFDGSLVIKLSNGKEINVGEVVPMDLAERIKIIGNGGGTSQTVIDTLASLQSQIDALIPSQTGNSGKFLTTNGSALSWASVVGGLSYQGTWNASTNSPSLSSGVGTSGYYYVVSVSGSSSLDGISDWVVGDWLLFNGTAWQKIDQSETLQSVTSTDSSVTVTTTGSTADLAVYSSPRVIAQIRNETGATLSKGTVVYISGASGNKATVSKALATSDTTSAQTFGVVFADISNNNNGYAILSGDISGLDTSAYAAGTQLYLSSSTAGGVTSTKQYAPNHLVYIGVVTRSHVNQGSIEVRIQNGYEMDELHNVSAQSPSNGQTLIYNTTTSLWEKANLTAGTGISVTNGAGSITVANTGVTSVTGTSPVASSGGATPAISLASGYGDTQNPYASKTANYVLASPNGSSGVPTFRAIVAADIPTLNQNTTGTASNVTGTVAVANGGTGITSYAVGDIVYASGTTTLSKLADVATGNALISGGVGVAPSYGKIGLTTHVSGTLPTANGGTNLTSFTANGVVYASSTSALATGSSFVFDGTNLGIGTTSPNAKLEVNNATAGAEVARFEGNYSASGTVLLTTWRRNGGAIASAMRYNDLTTMEFGTTTSHAQAFMTGGTERARVDTSGNVGIGTTSPSDSGSYGRALDVNGTTGAAIYARTNGSSTNYALIGSYGSDGYVANRGAGSLIFQNNNNERMRIDSSGYLLVGYTSSNGAYKLQVNSQIFATSSTIATSDGKYKENVQTLDGALDLVKALRPVQFSWKQHPVHAFDTTTPTIGFIAQEVQQILADKPYLNSIVKANECVIEPEVKDEEGVVTKEAVKEEFLGIAEGNLIALLTKAIQELKVDLDATKAELQALKAGQ